MSTKNSSSLKNKVELKKIPITLKKTGNIKLIKILKLVRQ